jgi:hypothetical protein
VSNAAHYQNAIGFTFGGEFNNWALPHVGNRPVVARKLSYAVREQNIIRKSTQITS